MTILPQKSKKPHLKSDRHGASRSSANSATGASSSSNVGYSGSGQSAKPPPPDQAGAGIDVTSGAMSTVGGMLPTSAIAINKKLRKYSQTTPGGSLALGAALASSSDSRVSVGSSAGTSGKLLTKRKTVPTGVPGSVVATAAAAPHEGCNSDDEYGAGFEDDELDSRFAERLKKARGLVIKEVKGDGACMFRAVADQVYGDEEMHDSVRRLCMDYIAKNRDHFSQFLTEDFDDYLRRKRQVDAHGNHVELQAISEIFSRPIEIFEYSIDPINTFHPISPEANAGPEHAPIRLSYHGTVHYNSVVDPYAATIGVGLGLPGLQPGLADRNLLREAKMVSEAQHIEETMLNDKLRMTDWEQTNDEMQRQIQKESYLAYLRQLEGTSGVAPPERRRDESEPPPASKSPIAGGPTARSQSTKSFNLGAKRGASSPHLPCLSRDDDIAKPLAKISRDDPHSSSLPNIGHGFGASFLSDSPDLMKPSTSASSLLREGGRSPAPSTSAAAAAAAKASTLKAGLYEELLASAALGLEDEWGNPIDEASMLAQAMALSQQEFFDSLKKSPGSDN